MKKRFYTAAFLSFFVFNSIFAKNTDSSSYKDNKLSIDLVYNQYIQNGNHSAVTGGVGTEMLNVYAPSVNINHENDRGIFNFNFGTDVITSASTDNIDYVKSSASYIDARTHANIGYSIKEKDNTFAIGTGISIESDYFSRQISFSFKNSPIQKRMSWGIQTNLNFDDLRWGRLNEGYYSPQYLIYPSELRSTQWFNNYKRNTYELKSKFEFKINSMNALAIYPELSLQNGLISTPFHRVYFNDGSKRVENLPNERRKLNLGFKWNSMLKNNQFIKTELDLFRDNFGITAISSEFTYILPVWKNFQFSPFLRLHAQKGAKYFKPISEHNTNQQYYTSDFDLSTLQSLKFGINIQPKKFMIYRKSKGHQSILKILSISNFRYAYFLRSDGLNAHVFGIVVSFKKISRKNLLF